MFLLYLEVTMEGNCQCMRPPPSLFPRITHKYVKRWASQVAQVVKNLPANAGEVRDVSWIPRLGRSPGERNGNPLQCS